MNVREASEALYILGCIPGANRYFIISGWLRNVGWTGCGDKWSEPTPVGDTTFSFDMAAYLMGFDKEYTYLITRESLMCKMEQFRITADSAFRHIRQEIARITETPGWQQLRDMMSGCEDDVGDLNLSEYEWAWVLWAEEMELEEREMV